MTAHSGRPNTPQETENFQPDEHGDVEFTITCKMRARWVPTFLKALRRMQWCGEIGTSRSVTVFADGDGDFRPRFGWSDELPMDDGQEDTARDNDGWFYDAG